MLVALVIEYLLAPVPQLAGSRKSWHLLLDVGQSSGCPRLADLSVLAERASPSNARGGGYASCRSSTVASTAARVPVEWSARVRWSPMRMDTVIRARASTSTGSGQNSPNSDRK